MSVKVLDNCLVEMLIVLGEFLLITMKYRQALCVLARGTTWHVRPRT